MAAPPTVAVRARARAAPTARRDPATRMPPAGRGADGEEQLGVGRRGREVGHDPGENAAAQRRREHGLLRGEPVREPRDGDDPDVAELARLTEARILRAGEAQDGRDLPVRLHRHVCRHAPRLRELPGERDGLAVAAPTDVLEQVALPRADLAGADLGVDEEDAGGADDDVVEVGAGLARTQEPVVQDRPLLTEPGQLRGDTAPPCSAGRRGWGQRPADAEGVGPVGGAEAAGGVVVGRARGGLRGGGIRAGGVLASGLREVRLDHGYVLVCEVEDWRLCPPIGRGDTPTGSATEHRPNVGGAHPTRIHISVAGRNERAADRRSRR